MAITTEEIIIDLQLNADASTKSLDQLEQELVSLKSAIKNVATGSDEFKKLQSEVIKADSRIKNLNKSIEGLDTEAMAGEIGKLAGGISASFTAVAAVVGNTSEEFEQFTKNIVTGIAVTQGLKGAQEAWTASAKIARQAQIAWNAAMAANPIGLVVTALAALTAGIYLLTKAFADNRTEQEKNIELLKLNSAAAKAFDTEVKNVTNSLLSSNLAYAEATDSMEAMELKLQQLATAEDLVVEKLKETSKVRQEELDAQLAAISQFEKVTDPQAAFDKIQKINDEKRSEQARLDASILNAAKDTANKLAVTQDALTKKIKKGDEDRLKSLVVLQDKLIKLIRDTNNRITAIEIETYTILNSNRAGLADYEIELLERNFELKKKMMTESNRDNINSLKKELADLQLNTTEKERLLKDSFLIEQDARNKNNQRVRDELTNQFITFQIAQEEYDKIKADNEKLFLQKQLKATEEFENEKAKISNNGIVNANSINRQITALTKALNKEIVNEAGKVEVEKAKIRKDFADQIFKDTVAVNERLELITLTSLEKQTSNQEEAFMVELQLNNSKFKTIIDLEEELALRRSSIQFFQEERAKEAVLNRLKLIKNASAEELALIQKLEDEIGALTTEQINELFRIKREFAEKRIQLERDILKSQISALQQNLDIELRLYEGHYGMIASLQKRRLDSEKTLALMSLEETYKADLMMAINNDEKKLEITQTYEESKKLIEDDFRQKKQKADLDAYKQIAKVGEELFANFQTIVLNQTTDRIAEELKAKNDALDAEIEALDGAMEAGIETEESKNDKLRAIELKREKAERKAAYDKAKAEKNAALVQAAIQTALAVLEASPVVPLMITAGILGAAQAAVIASQPLPQLRRGGKINGPKHEQGGVPLFKNGSQIAEVEGGELIMTAGVTNSPMLLQAASEINQLAGGVSFTNQPAGQSAIGITQPQVNVAAIVQETIRGITSIPVVNLATKTADVDRKVKNIEAKSRF